MEAPQPKTATAAALLQKGLKSSVHAGLRSLLVVSVWFGFYIVGSFVRSAIGWINSSYSLFSLEEDFFFVIGLPLIGLSASVATSAILLYHFLVGFEDEKSQLSVLRRFISLGFSGAILRITLPIATEIFRRIF